MKYRNIGGIVTVLLSAMIALTACGPSSLTVKDYKFSEDISELELDESQAPTILYKRPGAPSLSAYNRFIIDPVKVIYDDPEMKELSPEEVGRMQAYLRKAIITELRDGGYEVGTRSQAGTMRISFTISGLKAPSAAGNVTAAVAGISVSVGEVTVEGIFREAVSNRIDAVAVNRARGARTFNPKPWSTWADVEGSFDQWAKGFRKAVDRAHGR